MKGLRVTITGTDRSKAAFDSYAKNVNRAKIAGKGWNRGLSDNRRAIQQFGFQVADFSTQVAGGQSAMLAFTQQGGQMLQFFGPAGAVLAALVAVFGSLFIALQRSGTAMSELTPIAGVLADDFRAIGRALSVVKEIMIDFANVILNNMDTILIVAGTVAAFFATRWVIAFTAARVATLSLSAALVTLSSVLRRIGFLSILVLIGLVTDQIIRLTRVTGRLGEVFKLIGRIAFDVFDRIRITAALMVEALATQWLLMQSDWSSSVSFMMSVWGKFLRVVSSALFKLPGMTGLANKIAMDAAIAGQGAAEAASDSVRVMDDYREVMGSIGKTLSDTWTEPVDGWKELNNVMKEANDTGEKIDVRDWFNGADPSDGSGGSGGGKGGKSVADRLSEQAEQIKNDFESVAQSIGDAFKGTFKAIFDSSTSVFDKMKQGLASVLDKVFDVVTAPVWNALGNLLTTGILGSTGKSGRYSGGILSGILNGGGPLLSFAGGGDTPKGPRSGGIDGRGGFLAVNHPNERVIDLARGSSGAMSNVAQGTGRIVIELAEGLKASMVGDMRAVAVEVVERERPGIVQQSVQGAGAASRATKDYGGL